MQTVTFLNKRGEIDERQIADPNQIGGFLKNGFTVLNNPYDNIKSTTAPKVASTDSLAGTMTQSSTSPMPTNTTSNYNLTPQPGGKNELGQIYSGGQWVDTNDSIALKRKPTTISTQDANAEYIDNQQWLSDQQQQLEDNILKAQEAEEKTIRDDYELKKSRLQDSQSEESKSLSALEYKLGRKDTLFGQGEMSDLKRKQEQEVSALNGEMNELIGKMKSAIRSDKYGEFEKLQNAYNQRLDQQLKLKAEMRAQNSADLDAIYKNTQNQKIQQEIMQTNAETYAGALLSFDPETGEVIMPSEEDLNYFSEQTGIPLANLVQSTRTQAMELSKLSAEDRMREQQILKAQKDMIPEFAQEYQYAKDNFGFTGTWQQFLADKQVANAKAEDYMPKIVDINGEDYIQNSDGTFSKPSVPQIESQQKLQQARETISSITNLLNNPDLDRAIGPLSSRLPSISGKKEAIDAEIDTIIARLALDNLSLLKGPMSDRDIQFIKDASAGLRKDVSEEKFKEKLLIIKDRLVEGQNDVNYFAQNASQAKKIEFQTYANGLKQQFPEITPEEAFGLWREKNGGPKYEMGGEISSNIQSSFSPGAFGGQCGEFTHQIVDFPPMGDMYSEKCASVDKYGVRRANWVPQVGDVVISDASDVSRTGQPLKYGHASVVLTYDPKTGTGTYIESNLKGNEKISIGRKFSINDPAIYGALRGNIKQKFLS